MHLRKLNYYLILLFQQYFIVSIYLLMLIPEASVGQCMHYITSFSVNPEREKEIESV